MLQDGIGQKGVSLLRPVSMKGVGMGQVVDGGFHRFGTCLRDGACHISYSQMDDVGLGMGYLERIDFFCNVCKQVIVRKLHQMFVN